MHLLFSRPAARILLRLRCLLAAILFVSVASAQVTIRWSVGASTPCTAATPGAVHVFTLSSPCSVNTWSLPNAVNGTDYTILQNHPTALTLQFLKPRSYTISSSYGSCGFGSFGTTSTNVVIYAPPTITITSSAQNVSPYEAVTLTASGASSLQWSGGDGSSYSAGGQITVFPSQTTTYTVTASGTGACSSTQGFTVNVLNNPDPFNWTQQTVYGETLNETGGQVAPGTQVVVGESRQYSDLHGRPTQSQARQITDGTRLVAQALYDGYGVAVGQTLPAPVGSATFGYQANFITRNGQPYTQANFEDGKLLAPDPVDNTTAGTLGWYYSDNNTWEPYVDKTSYPYSRSYTATDGTVSRAAGAGDQHRMGTGRESRTASVPLLNELDAHYLKVRNLFVATPATASLRYRGTKSVAVDVNGREMVSFADRDGKLLATCRTDPSFTPMAVSGTIDAAGPVDGDGNLTPRYLDIHVPQGAPTAVALAGTGRIRIYNETDGTQLYPAPPATDGPVAGQTLAPGFYRIVSVSGTQTVSYGARYGEFSYQLYDDAGRQLAGIAPKGVDLAVIPASSAAVTFATTYQTAANGDLLKAGSPDEGSTEYVYRKDGTLRFSQNAQQKLDKRFSYVNYDRLGRTLQSGVYQMPGATNTAISLEGQLQALWTAGYNTVLEDKTRTGGLAAAACRETTDSYHDLPAADLPAAANGRRQRFLTGAVSKTRNANVTTWYSYDELGRAEWMIQDIAGLGVKILDYRHDRNGRLRESAFQKDDAAERFSHYYTYDADLRLSQVHTSRDGGATRTLQARYIHYRHGPLKRVELAGNLQGTDYTYTLQGWLKAVNHPDGARDPGRDGAAGTPNAAFAPDAFGMTLEYFSGDYTRAGTGIAHRQADGFDSYWSGRIKALAFRTQKPATVTATQGAAMENPAMQAYRYDARYQLTEAVWGTPDLAAATGTNAFAATALYRETISGYDAHGNITGLTRTDGTGAVKHAFAYQYAAGGNKLDRIPGYARYQYDASGRMTAQEKDGAGSPVPGQYLEYDAAGLVVAVYSDAAKTQRKVSYGYDEGGLRVKKINHVTNITTWYVNGIVYDNENTSGGAIVQKEIPLQGSGRIGIYRTVENRYDYELTDHLGNVRAVISGVKVSGRADVLEYADYYALGGVARSGGTMQHRHGYQGQYAEKDGETGWNAFELRQYDAVTGRWLSPDPYGQYDSPYVGMGNDWVNQVDPDGGFTRAGAWLYNLFHCGGAGTVANYHGFWQVAYGGGVAAGAVGSSASAVVAGAASASARAVSNAAWHAAGVGPEYDGYSFRQKAMIHEARFVEAAREPMTDMGRAMANFSPVTHAVNIGSGLDHGADLWGEQMSGADYASEALGVIPAGGTALNVGKATVSTVLRVAKKIKRYPIDFATKNTRNFSGLYNSERQARTIAMQKLGKNPIKFDSNKMRSVDGKWQYRAKPGDIADRHIHMERLNPETGEVLYNLHLRWK